MFTGIIKEVAKVSRVIKQGSLSRLEVVSDLVFKIAQISESIAVNGACLTLTRKNKSCLCFDVAASTLSDTNIKFFKKNEPVNLEPALELGGKLGGHFVLGHIDSILKIKKISDKKGYWEIEVFFPPDKKKYIVDKGSIALDGISLTVKKILPRSFTVDVIPFTYEHTNLRYKKPGSWVNAEFDYLLKKKS